MNNTINYKKIFTTGAGGKTESEYKPPSINDLVTSLEAIPAVCLRGHLDHLLIIDDSKEETVWSWNVDILKNMNQYDLQYLLSFVKKRYEFEKARGVAKPVVRHTSS